MSLGLVAGPPSLCGLTCQVGSEHEAGQAVGAASQLRLAEPTQVEEMATATVSDFVDENAEAQSG